MPEVYDPFEAQATTARIPLPYIASEVMNLLGYADHTDIENAMHRTFEICLAMHIPIEYNFRKIYRYDENGMETDWELSKLACYLLVINGNPLNPVVAKAQLHFIVGR